MLDSIFLVLAAIPFGLDAMIGLRVLVTFFAGSDSSQSAMNESDISSGEHLLSKDEK